nr:hypothetical protein [Tanacetum cinerariifolium]
MVNKLGYSDKVTMFYHFKKPGCDLDNGLHTLRNDSDVLALGEYVTEISTPKNSCIIEAPDDIILVKRPNKFPPKKCSKSVCARNLLGWNEIRDRLGVGKSSQVTKVGQGSQSNPTPIVQPSAFVDDFYAVDDHFNGQCDFKPLFCLDDKAPLVNVYGTVKGKGKAIEVDVGDKGKGIAIDDEIESLEDAEDEEQGSEEEESDGFLDVENPVEEVDMDVIDPDEFESASDEDGLERIRSRKLKQLRKQGKTKDDSVPNTVFFVGKEFATADDVKKDIHKLSIETGRELFLKKMIKLDPQSKSKFVGGKPNARKLAANQCPFVIHVSKLRDYETWKVKTFDDTHK